MISDPLEIANYFNEYFVNVGPNLAKKVPESPMNFKSYLDETNCNSIFLDAMSRNLYGLRSRWFKRTVSVFVSTCLFFRGHHERNSLQSDTTHN